MNITFLVGNGFDLNLGLDTTFSSFLKEYTSEISKEENEKETAPLYLFKKDILKDAKQWSSAERAFGKYTKELDNTKEGAALAFCECHEDFCISLGRYLENQESRLDMQAMGNDAGKEFAKSINIANMLSGFREVTKSELNNALGNFGGGFTYHFLDFNYTRTLDNFFSVTKNTSAILGTRGYSGVTYPNKLETLIHVHGYTDKDMVLGVNDESQIENIHLFEGYGQEYKNQIIKPKTNEMNERLNDKKAAEIISKSDFIYVYGMSIGETDAIWWQRIISAMLKKAKLHLIIHCHSAPKREVISRKYYTFSDKIKNHFLSFSGKDIAVMGDIKNRIHIDAGNIFSPLETLSKKSFLDKKVVNSNTESLVSV